MDDDRQRNVGQILKTIEFGSLSREEIEKRLSEMIETELSKPNEQEVNTDLIDLCTSLLWQLHTHGNNSLPDHSAESRKEVERRIEKIKRRRNALRNVLRSAAIIVILVVGLSAFQLLPPIRWFTGTSTIDEEQYIVKGHEISPQAVAHCIEQHEGFGLFTSTSKKEMDDYLGLEIRIPTKLANRYTANKYYVSIVPEQINYKVLYIDEEEQEGLSLMISLFDNIDNARIAIEQEENGKKTVIDGTSIYSSENLGTSEYVWIKDNRVYLLESQFLIQDIGNILHEIME